VVDVDCAMQAAPCLTPPDGMGYEIDEAEVAYWGRCPQCVAQAKAASPQGTTTSTTTRRRLRRTARLDNSPV
jgi:Fur family ferric uptake transcriptional regulator